VKDRKQLPRDLTTLGPFESVTVNISTHVTTEIKTLQNETDAKLSVLTANLARVVLVAEGLADIVDGNTNTVDSAVAPMPAVPVSGTNVGYLLLEAIREEGVETRWLIERQAAETRWFNAKCTMVVLFFLFVQVLLNYFHPPMCALIPPVRPVCAPGVNVTDWSEFAKNVRNEFVKNARDEWAH